MIAVLFILLFIVLQVDALVSVVGAELDLKGTAVGGAILKKCPTTGQVSGIIQYTQLGIYSDLQTTIIIKNIIFMFADLIIHKWSDFLI